MDCLETLYADLSCKCDKLSIIVSIGYPFKYSKKKVSITIDEDGYSKKQFDGSREQVYTELAKTRVCGIEDITEMFIDKTDDGEFYIITSGSNLRKLLLHPLVDISRLYTNNIWEMYECLGVAATKRMIIKDLKECISGVNDCHLRLLADKMTFKGKPFAITRYTMRVNDVGALSKATFEQSVDIIQSAAFKGEIDTLNGVSSAIVAGNQIRAGTGMVDLMIDWEKMIVNDDVCYEQ
jgi:DNA-directed RNA polymerase subunit A'